MAISLRGTYVTNSDSATNLSLNLASLTGGSGSAAVNGDLVIVHATHDTGASALSGTGAGSGGGASYEPPLQDISDNASASVRSAVWARIWVTGDSTTPTFQTAGAANNMILRCSVWNLGGATLGTIESNALGLNTAAATITATGITFSGSNELQWLGMSADDLVTVSTAPTGLASPNDMTLIGYTATAAMAAASYYHLSPPSGSLAPTLVWSGNTERIALHVRVPVTVAGPTIDTQPTAQTARLHGEATTAATFTVAATASGGSLSDDWELEDSVGAGTYTNVANGNGLTFSGGTFSGGTANLVVTATTTAKSGCRVRCNVTDLNGTVTTNAVALTILNGPVLSVSSGTTNGSGVLTTALSSDDALTTNGEILRIRATFLAVTKDVSGRPA